MVIVAGHITVEPQRESYLTVAVQEYIADVRPVFGKEAE